MDKREFEGQKNIKFLKIIKCISFFTYLYVSLGIKTHKDNYFLLNLFISKNIFQRSMFKIMSLHVDLMYI